MGYPYSSMYLVILFFNLSTAFVGQSSMSLWRPRRSSLAALGDFSLELEKPLGVILEERAIGGGGGVRVDSLMPDGAAAASGAVAPGDVLLKVGAVDVSNLDFDSIMDLLAASPDRLQLTLGDGLGRMDMAKNVAKTLEPEQAFFVDAVVRAAVREARRKGTVGDVESVEIVIGAGFQENGQQCLVRFFAIFSRDGGVSTFTGQVSATGVRSKDGDGKVEIRKLSVAKDEGLGQTLDLI